MGGRLARSLRGWLPTLRSASLASSGEGAQLEFRSSLALAFDRVSASLDAARAHAHVALLPTGFHLPVIHTALVDGRSPAAPPGGRAASRPCEGSQPSVRGAGLLAGRAVKGVS